MIGIDKISLHTREFNVKNNTRSGLMLKLATVDLNTGENKNMVLFSDSYGMPVEGVTAYANIEDLYSLNIDRRGMQVIFNPSKFMHPYNLTAQPDHVNLCINAIVKDLKGRGITAPMVEANVTRIDLAKNELMNQPCHVYSSVFPLLSVKRMKDAKTYPDGYGVHNTRWGLNFYNKGREQNLELNNLMRGELQFKQKPVVHKQVGISTYMNLIEASPDHFKDTFNRNMNENVFRTKSLSNQLPMNFIGVQETFMQLVKVQKQGAVNTLKNMYGIQYLMEQVGGVDRFKLLLFEAGLSKQAVFENIKKVKRDLALSTNIHGKNSMMGKLYRELILKFAA